VKIAYLAPEIPALSATFVYNEILQLEQMGAEVLPFSVHRPFSEVTNNKLDDLKRKVIHIYERSKLSVLWSHIRILIKHPRNYWATLKIIVADMLQQGLFTRNALALAFRFFYAGFVADVLIENKSQHLHVHFAHVPTDIAMYAASLSGITFSVMAHANDLFERGWLLKQKVERSAFFATISEFNIGYLAENEVDTGKVCIIRCGVTPDQFSPRNNFISQQPVKIGVVGRLVEKKGIDTLIKAIAALKKQGRSIKLFIAGSGPLKENLAGLANKYDLKDNEDVIFLGAIAHSQVADFIKSLDVFVLPCKKDENGDMDGIPVVLMEAMLSAVPVVSTSLSGIPELIINQKTGLLVQPDNPKELEEAILNIVDNDELRTNIIENAVSKVKTEFSLSENTNKLNVLFQKIIN
jgi:glycosyltransferase involved in cell wall biosynthesis